MFTVLYRHEQSDWQSTDAFLYVIEKPKHGNILLSLTLKETTLLNIFTIYTL